MMRNSIILLVATFFVVFALKAQTDNCTTAPSLTPNASCVTTNYSIPTSFTDNLAGEPPCGNNFRDGFFRFTATSLTTTVTITDNSNAQENPGLMILSGPCGGPYTILGCSQAGNGVNESVSVTTTPGTTYWAVIFVINSAGTGAPNTAASGTICVQAITPPSGGVCETPIPLTIGVTACGTNNNVGSFPNAGVAPFNGCVTDANDGEYWYSVVGTGSALEISMSNLTNTTSMVFVYQGCPASGGTCLGGGNPNFLTLSNYSIVTPVLTAGMTYFIVVAGFGTNGTTNYCLNAIETTPPITASDCSVAVNVCTNLSFRVDPNGFGTINEIPTLGTVSNPDYAPAFGSPANP